MDCGPRLPAPSTPAALALAARCRSAAGPDRPGGDLYDVLLTPNGPRLIIGDVKGHGPAAAPLAATVLDAARPTATTEPDPARLATTLDARLRPHLDAEDFVTLLVADFHPHEVRLANCGHPPPLHITRRRLDPLTPRHPSPPLGLDPAPRVQRIRLLPDQRLLLYTDGLTEARAADGTFFPLDSRARAALLAPTLDQALDTLLDLHHQHTRHTPAAADDLTLLLAQPTSPDRPY
ncbi:PP2C family protein-serine/threonine phosphatase [Streptomyces poonensis]|uniref:PPM-type phosphatase domain-containing protein n=1 Tax=Streptomyces poonensis TaxID=68255 RepID=A0A918P8Y5_9ACTN|nr:PP2C family protein-serine/threonine phosphatase [Streptomyces poonensis]GGY90747.1 hypothetical protein GCM10010365_06440 [Streptomyces poonensis]GLJ87919.1 hypothetical protein GCM10017589_05190 [Streptomyces poonensis]